VANFYWTIWHHIPEDRALERGKQTWVPSEKGNDDTEVPQTKSKMETDEGTLVKNPCRFSANIT
jgi:hypothetical protein